MSQVSHDEPAAPPGLASKNAGACIAIAAHQTTVVPIMINIAARDSSGHYRLHNEHRFGNSSRLATAIANTVHSVKVIARSVTQNKNRIPYQWRPPFR